MRRTLSSLALISLVALAGADCSPAVTPRATAAPTPTAAPARAATIRIELPDAAEAGDIPRHLAAEALEAQGYKIEKVSFEDSDMALVAMEKDELDFVTSGDLFAWNAIAQGAPMFLVLDEVANTQLLVVSNDIQACADLNGKRIAINSISGSIANLLYRYIDKDCPGTAPQYLVIGRAGNRLAALEAGEIDGLSLQLYNYLTLDESQAAKLHVLVSYAEEFPGLTITSNYVRRGLAEQYPETVKDIVREILLARRRIQDPQVLTDELTKRLELEPDVARKVAEAYLGRHMWDVNGALTLSRIQDNMNFLIESGAIPADLKAADVADLSYLDAVLAEIGRQ